MSLCGFVEKKNEKDTKSGCMLVCSHMHTCADTFSNDLNTSLYTCKYMNIYNYSHIIFKIAVKITEKHAYHLYKNTFL